MDAPSRVGALLKGKYQLEALLGCGGMAAVYRATHRNGNRVAVKILHPELSYSEDIRARFLREGYVANKVQHKGAVRVLDDDEADDGAVFLVMDLLEGETLDARCTRAGGRLPVDEVVYWATALLDTLAAAHAQGIVHRDVKPENLFVTTEGALKVLDFGIARLLDGSKGAHVTRTGRLMGTPAFLPPEQALGYVHDVDARSDLYAVGATMFTLLAGRYVHEARTAEEMLVFAATRQAPPLREVVPECPAAVAAVVDRALAFDKNARFADARTMQAALARVSMGSVKTLLASKPPPRALPEPPTNPVGTVPTDAGVAQTNGSVPGVPRSAKPLWIGLLVAGVVGTVATIALVPPHTEPARNEPGPTQSFQAAASQAPLPEAIVSAVASSPPATSSAPVTPHAHAVGIAHSTLPTVFAAPSAHHRTSTTTPSASAPPVDVFHP